MTTSQSVGATCMSWWRASIVDEAGPARRSRAQLRRAAGITAALSLSATHDLNRRLIEAGMTCVGEETAPIGWRSSPSR